MLNAGLSENEFSGKVALVTGANSGIGEATVLELARRRAKVFMLVRSRERGQEASERIRKAFPAADIYLVTADLSLASSVISFFADFNERVDILINNAGVFGSPYCRTKEGVEMVLASNHLGHFLLTCLMLSRGLLGPDSRIILVTGAMYKKGSLDVNTWDEWNPDNYHKMQAYRNSKLAVCLFALWLRSAVKRVIGSSVKVFAVHPGVVNTAISRHLMKDCMAPCRACLRCCMATMMQSPIQGCHGILMCAADRDDSHLSGSYFNNRRLEAWHKPILNDDLVLECWDFSFGLVQQSVKDQGVIKELKKLRDIPQDTLDDLAKEN